MVDKDLSKNLVVQSNDLLVAVCSMTLKEKQVFLACISQVDSRKILDDGKRFVLSVEQAQGLFYSNKDKSNAYKDLRAVADRLYERTAIIRLDEHKTLKTRFVQSVIFDDETDSISILFADDIKPYISELESNFTKYKLAQIQQITNKNAVRLFELCVMWLGQAKTAYIVKEFELDELREVLGLVGKYKQFGQLKTMLVSAVKQLNESTDINIKMAFKKQRASYKFVQLKIEKVVKQEVLNQPTKQTKTINTAKQNWKKTGLTDGQIGRLSVDYRARALIDNNQLAIRKCGISMGSDSYTQVFNKLKPYLKNPAYIEFFEGVQECLDLDI